MSQLITITSTTRPASPLAGDVYFESDTTRIVVYNGTDYVVFNKDSISFATGGTEELHYAGGPFSNAGAEYFVPFAPVLHFDASRPDGSSLAPANLLQMVDSQATGSDWKDRLDISQKFRDGSWGATYDHTRNAWHQNGRYLGNLGNHVNLAGDFTYFHVQEDPTQIIGLGQGNNNSAEMLTFDGTNMYLGGHAVSGGQTIGNNGISGNVDLFVVRRSNGVTRLWTLSAAPLTVAGTDYRSRVAETTGAVNNMHIRAMGNYGPGNLSGYQYESILFDSALDQANMDLVHKYFVNKFTGVLSHTRKDGSSQIVTDVTDQTQWSKMNI